VKANNEEPVQASASEAQIERPPAQEEAKPDPWGIRRAEVLLTSLKGVLSARVVAAATGEITEVHVLTEAGLTPKQSVRNVESALLAQLGIKLDHRKISVAQTAEILPIEAMEDRAALDRARKRGVVFRRVEVTPTTPHRVTVTVTMERDGQELVAQENAGDADKMRLAAAARATVSILDGLTTTGTIDLAGARLVDAFDTRLAFVGIHVLEGREVRLHVGTCEVKGGVEQAGTLAVLDATNRWLTTTL
jgi:hypothetical protein